MTFKLRRRTLLASGIAAATGAYLYQRGLRYPTLSLEASDLPNTVSNTSGQFWLTDCFQMYSRENQFRAFAPEPALAFEAKQKQQVQISINNIATEAVLDSKGLQVQEEQDGITRMLTFEAEANTRLEFGWRVPFANNYHFAAIGDSGGDHELAWCIERAAELGAKFLLHLGDFNYQEADAQQPGDYARSIDLFHNAPIPCYVSIGNHDFHDSGLLHHQFTDYIGPFNNVFSLGAMRFINLDTAANVWPRSGGKRGRLVNALLKSDSPQPTSIAFTHRPLHDPTGVSTHDIGNSAERDWLVSALHNLNAKTLLCGHIHIFERTEFQGIDHIIVGQGLGHQDLLTGDNTTSKIALGNVDEQGLANLEFVPLNMPFELHCHPRVEPVKASLRGGEHTAVIERVDAACTDPRDPTA